MTSTATTTPGLADASWRQQEFGMYIGGRWVPGDTDERREVYSPSLGSLLGTVPVGTRGDSRKAIEAANRARAAVRRLSVADRSALCHRIADVVEVRRDELSLILALEQGKPRYTEAYDEVSHVVQNFRLAAEEVLRLGGETIPALGASKRVYTYRQARGVYAVVTPWNFPMNIPAEYLGPGLATGNCIVWVPAPSTSICAVKLMECIEEADIPEGMVNLVIGEGPVVGDEIVSNPGTDAVGFTGSPVTGRTIATRAAGKPLLLELGGNGPTLVFEDAELEHAASAVASACFFNAGQSCAATERILVSEQVHDEFVGLLVAEARRFRLGSPLERETTLGPLNNEATAAKMDQHITDARERGARLLLGGGRREGAPTSLYYEATVLDGVHPASLVNHEESFGPVAPVLTFSNEAEALALANDNTLGLNAAIFTRSMPRAWRFAEQMRSGIVNVNDHSNYWESHIPFGGVAGKQSGIGRLGGKHTLLEMTDLRTIIFEVERGG